MEQMGKEKGEGVVKNWLLQNGPGDVKDSIGNTVAKEYICMTHGQGQQCGDCLREWGRAGWRGAKEEKLGKL